MIQQIANFIKLFFYSKKQREGKQKQTRINPSIENKNSGDFLAETEYFFLLIERNKFVMNWASISYIFFTKEHLCVTSRFTH